MSSGQPRDDGIGRGRVSRRGNRRLRPRAQLFDLRLERPPARLELEQHRLRRLAREPELAALRVVAEPLARHGRNGGRQERLLRDDRQIGLARLDDDRERAEPRRPRALEQRERGADVVGDERRRALAQRRRDRAFHPGLDVEHRQREPLALLGQRTSRRR